MGLATLTYGVIVGLMNLSVWLALRAASEAAETAIVLTVLTGLQIPAGIGILRYQSWGRQLAQALTLGTVIIAGLFAFQSTLGTDGGHHGATFPIVPIAISLLLNLSSVRDRFGTSGNSNA